MMDRLTVRIDGEAREDHSRDTREWRNGGRKCMERLAAYEDTGLLPEICANYKKFEDESIANGVPFSRIIELMNADAAGRVVVVHPNQRPSLSFGVRPSCWYTDKPNGYFCIGFCHGLMETKICVKKPKPRWRR